MSKESEEGIEDENPGRRKEPTMLNQTGHRRAAHTAGCPPPSQDRSTRHGQGVRRLGRTGGPPRGRTGQVRHGQVPGRPGGR